MKKETSLGHDIVIITLITLVAGLLLGVVHTVTAGPIARQEEKTRIETQKAVFSDAASFEPVEGIEEDAAIVKALEDAGLSKTSVEAVDVAYDGSGEKLGYVITSVNKEGYGGEIKIMTGISSKDGSLTVNSIAFLTLAETAGMGMKADLPDFRDQFKGLDPGQAMIEYTKNGKSADHEIDAISGSTVTTKAVTKAVNAAIAAARYLEGGAS
ncbi:MAG: FMN-binding protein [Lachnospiraceae bacterium]|nr:FMN-binding protein [Lachnospiraceae bacterium]